MEPVNILVVEDELVIAMDLQTRLERLGYNVLEVVSTGEQSIEKAVTLHPDIILMDVILQGNMDGVEATQKISEKIDVPIIYSTAHDEDETLERIKLTAPYGYILKPYQDRELRFVIEISLQRHLLRQQFENNERWLNSILSSIKNAVIATDKSEHIQFMNKNASLLTGWSIGEAQGRSIEEIYHPVHHTGLVYKDKEGKRAIDEGLLSIWYDYPILKNKDGKEFPVQSSKVPVYHEKGGELGSLYIFRDVAPYKDVQDWLHEAKNKFRYVLDNSTSSILIHGVEGRLIDVNQKACEMLGYSRDLLLSSPMSLIDSSFNIHEFHKQVSEWEVGKTMHEERIYLRRDRSTFPVREIRGLCPTSNHDVILVIFRGITEGDFDEIVNEEIKEFNEIFTLMVQIFSKFEQLYQL